MLIMQRILCTRCRNAFERIALREVGDMNTQKLPVKDSEKPFPKQKKRKKWIKVRHRVVRVIAYLILKPISRVKYGIRIEPIRDKRQFVILLNHQTPFDQFFVGMAFPRVIYYLASEDIFSNGFVSSLIRFLVAPIPIQKQTTDIRAIKTLLSVAREGGSIAIAPEGNRTYSGKTEYMAPSIAPLVRRMKLPVALLRIEGGYGVHPRWSDKTRKGKMRAYVSRIIEPEEYASLTDDELFAIIRDGLYVNEASLDGEYKSRHGAEYLERMLYVCPFCGLSRFESHGNTVTCTTCGQGVRYLPTKELSAIESDFPFRFLSEWYEYQKDFINKLDTLQYTEKPLYEDTATLSEVIVYKKKKRLLKNAPVALYGDRVTVGDMIVPFSEATAVTVLGRNKLNLYYEKRIYQLKGDKRFNAVKYVNLYHRYKNITTGDGNGKFLGL